MNAYDTYFEYCHGTILVSNYCLLTKLKFDQFSLLATGNSTNLKYKVPIKLGIKLATLLTRSKTEIEQKLVV